MSWVTALYTLLIGASAAIALPNLLVGIWQRRAAQLFFVGVVIGTIGLAAGELAMMYATTVEQYARALRWVHVPIFVGFIAIVGFVQLYFGTGRLWLGITVGGLRLVCLVINFLSPLNLNFRAITGLSHIPVLGEMVSTATGLASPWNYLSHLTSLLLIVFVADASISLWRKGEPRDRRRALTVGGSIVLFLTLSAVSTALFYLRIIPAPYFLSVWFFAILSAMAFELGYDLFVAGQVAQKLQASEASLLESELRFGRMADAAPVMIWTAGPDKLCTFFNKAWLDFTGRTMEQELGNGWSEGVHPDDLESCLKTYVERFDALEPFFMKYRLRRYDGTYRYMTDTGVPRYGSRGKFRGYIGACLDVTDMLEKERALRESEERMSLAMDAAKLGLWEWNVNKDVLWGSKARRALLGLPVTGKIALEEGLSRVHVDDRDRVRRTLKDAARTGEDYHLEYRVVLADGSVQWTDHRGRCVRGADGKDLILRGISMDVTQRKRAEEEFRMAVEASPSGILLVNQTGQIVLVNSQIEQLFGYGREELIGHSVEILVPERFAGAHPEHRAKFFAAPAARAMGAGRELFGRRKDGSEFPVEIGLNPIESSQGTLVLAVVVDISERKRAEEKFRMAVEASPSGILLVNQTGQIVLVNSQIEQLFGYGREELIGQFVEILVPERFAGAHPEHRAKFFAAPAARAMGAGRELFGRRKDGSEFPVEIGLNPIQSPEGMLILAAVVDISERKHSEEEARKSREQISRLSRISLLGEMTAAIAHELGQPLSGISSNASAGQRFIDRGAVDIATLREILVDIEAQSHRANSVIQNIRNTIKKGAALRERINLNDLITRLAHMLQPDARAHSCQLNISLPDDLPLVQGDPVQIQQVLVNLVGNAFEAMRDTPRRKRRVEIAAEQIGDGMVCVSVRDQGAGISVEAREHIFDQFFTTKEEGLGMGLAIVRSVIEAHGGKIQVENLDGAGALFSFTLPTRRPGS